MLDVAKKSRHRGPRGICSSCEKATRDRTSLADEVAFTKRIIALQDGLVLLVGHPWGGAVITQADDDPKALAGESPSVVSGRLRNLLCGQARERKPAGQQPQLLGIVGGIQVLGATNMSRDHHVISVTSRMKVAGFYGEQ
jgi:hypothetical protein